MTIMQLAALALDGAVRIGQCILAPESYPAAISVVFMWTYLLVRTIQSRSPWSN